MTRTPYDTGKRSEPKVWTKSHIEDEDDYGKVDFDDDAGGTVATLYIEKDDDGIYALRGYANDPLKLEVENYQDPQEPVLIQPSEALKARVKEVIAGLYSPYERDEAEVYWQDGQALILVPGERHVRKQQVIMVYEPGSFSDVNSAIVKDWETGVQRTRID